MLRDIKEMKSDKFLKYGLVENLIQAYNSKESSSLELQHLTIQILSIVTQNPKSKRYFNEILAFFATFLEDKKTLDEEILTNITLGLSYFVMNENNIAIDKRIIPSVIEIFEHQNLHVHLFADRTLKMYSDFITRKNQESILNGKMIVEYLPKMLEHEYVFDI
uniref:Uncharacterized protein n=1 Tax=Panagrolaimus davidi TaxID=227884 RepID=A0A914PVT5_9BILA